MQNAADFIRYLLAHWQGNVSSMSAPWVPAWVRLCAEWHLNDLESHYARLCQLHLSKMLLSDSYAPPGIRVTGACGVYADAINGTYEQLDAFSEGAPIYSKLVTADDTASVFAADRDGPMCLAYYGGDWNLAVSRNIAKRDAEGNFTCTAFLQLTDTDQGDSDGLCTASDKAAIDPVTVIGEWQVDAGEEGQGFETQTSLHLEYFCSCHTSATNVNESSGWAPHQEQLQQDVALFWDMVIYILHDNIK